MTLPPVPQQRSSRLPKWLVISVRVALVALVTWFAIRAVAGQWDEVRAAAADLQPRWWLIALSCVIVLATYAMLTEAWRSLVQSWGRPVRYLHAARMWCISSLGRYVPGKVWQIGVLAVLSRQHQLSASAAVGSALLISAIHTAVGFGVVAIFGAGLLDAPVLVTVVLAAGVFSLLLAPRLLPGAAMLLARLTGRNLTVPRLAHRTIWMAVTISFISWLAYGIAFWLLALAVLPELAGGPALFVAVFTFSYLLGFLALFAPGGIVVRELALGAALVNAGMGEGSAILLAVISRLWLTVLELAPALAFLAYDQLRRLREHERPAKET